VINPAGQLFEDIGSGNYGGALLNAATGGISSLISSIFGGGGEKSGQQTAIDNAAQYTVAQAMNSGDKDAFINSGKANTLFWNILNGKPWDDTKYDDIQYSSYGIFPTAS
jgi:hypothetical protein